MLAVSQCTGQGRDVDLNRGQHIQLNPKKQNPADIKVGLVGLGLMGTSIAACLLSAGHSVMGVENSATRRRHARQRVLSLLQELKRERFTKSNPSRLLSRFDVSGRYSDLSGSGVVIEAITESWEAKRRLIQDIEGFLSPHALLATNTSAIPINDLQRGMHYPGRFLGLHWSEPAHVTVFMEIIRGEQTLPPTLRLAMEMARAWWGKRPVLVRRAVRGFITNRISYAMFREACYLVDAGVATAADVDQSLRNDVGWWVGLVGPFRYMDLMGVQGYAKVMRELLPDLSCSGKVPMLIQKASRAGANGISNRRGFYRYTPAQARQWEKAFRQFTYDMRRLTMKYDELISKRASHPAPDADG